MTGLSPLPPEFESVKAAVLHVLRPIKPIDGGTSADKRFLFTAKRTNAGRELPPYYLVFFLMVELLGFEYLGQFEKIAWSIPIDFNGKAFLIEHRKMGLGVFVHDLAKDEGTAREIVLRIKKAVKIARPFFDWLAKKAIECSQVNVINVSHELFSKYKFFVNEFYKHIQNDREESNRHLENPKNLTQKDKYWLEELLICPFGSKAKWLGHAAIDAFFGWTEHIFIHIAVLTGRISSASEVAKLAESDWADKYKSALDLFDSQTKQYYDQLVNIRKEIRNYVAHGAFGKQGEAFKFHSGAGTVPVLLPHKSKSLRFTLGEGLDLDLRGALKIIESFVSFLWSGNRSPLEAYIQSENISIILTMANDKTYAQAIQSLVSMKDLVRHLNEEMDRSRNMDW